MKKNLDRRQQIEQKYKDFFFDENGKSTMIGGIDIGNGWLPLIETICEYATFVNKNIDYENQYRKKYQPKMPQLEKNNLKFITIKEKFGGLRCYLNNASPQIDGAVQALEMLSYKICENCGISNNVTQNKEGWIKTLCNNCRKKI